MEPESEHSDEEEEYTYCLKSVPVYVRPSMPLSKPHSDLSAVAPEFQPMRQLTEKAQVHQPHDSAPAAVPDSVQRPAPATTPRAATPPAKEPQEGPARDDTVEEANLEELVDNIEHVAEPPGGGNATCEEVNSSNKTTRSAHI